jgi:hypothetical protein
VWILEAETALGIPLWKQQLLVTRIQQQLLVTFVWFFVGSLVLMQKM